MKLDRVQIKKARIEVIPMIDVILMLLIFYMSFAKFVRKEGELAVRFPTLRPDGIVLTPEQTTLRVARHVLTKDRIQVENRTLTIDGFINFLNTFRTFGTEDVVFIITGEKTAKYQDVVDALNSCAIAGIDKVAFEVSSP